MAYHDVRCKPHYISNWWLQPLLLILFATCVTVTGVHAQDYRFWHDTTTPEPVVPKHIGQNSFPIGVFFYHYNHNFPVTDIWEYLDSVNADHGLYSVETHYEGTFEQDRWQRYVTLMQNAPTELGILPVPTWDVSVIGQINHCREVTFYPFDSSQLGGIDLTGMNFFAYGHDYEENVFTDYSYDSTGVSTDHGVFEKNVLIPRREVYYDTGMANETVASGIAFNFKDGQTERWEQTWDGSQWNNVSNSINSSAYFDGLSFDEKYSFRSPHSIVLTGHLFEFGAAADLDPLIRIDVYYEVGVGEDYIDSNDVLKEATTNIRFLYKSVTFTKEDLLPEDLGDPDWDAHVIVAKEINFEEEDMGGPTAEDATAHSIDIEVVYLGGEKVALHSVALRDKIAHDMLRQDAPGDSFRTALKKQIDSLLLQTAGTTYPKTAPNALQNLYITDEPNPFASTPLRRAKEEIELSYVYGNGDTLTTGNGWAIPHLQWTGGMDWTANGSYFTHYLGNLGDAFGFNDGNYSGHSIPNRQKSLASATDADTRDHTGGLQTRTREDCRGSPGIAGPEP